MKNSDKKKKRKRRYRWSFDKMHPALQVFFGFIGGLIILGGAWVLLWCVYLAWLWSF